MTSRAQEYIQEEFHLPVDKNGHIKLHPSVVSRFKFHDPSPLLSQELDRKARGAPLNAIDTRRLSLQGPEPETSHSTPETSKRAELNAQVQLEYQQQRLDNLQLLRQYGPNAWRINTFAHESELLCAQRELALAQDELQQLESSAERSQEDLDSRMSKRQAAWAQAISNRLEQQVALLELAAQCDDLEHQKLLVQTRISKLNGNETSIGT